VSRTSFLEREEIRYNVLIQTSREKRVAHIKIEIFHHLRDDEKWNVLPKSYE
jgi:hypothetical protein